MPRLTYSFSTSFWAVPRICDGSRPWRPQATWYIATSTAAGALIVIDVDTSSSGIPSNIASTSDAESTATPTRPTSPAARGSSESRPIWVGRSNATDSAAWPSPIRNRKRRLVSSPVPKPAYCRIDQGRPRIHVAVDAAGIGIAARLAQPRLQIAGHVVGGGEGPRPVAHVLAPWPSASAPTSTTILPTCWFSFIS